MSTTKVVTGKVRFSYCHVFEPSAISEGADKKYSVSLIIPKKDTATVEKLKAAIKMAFEEGKAKFGGKLPSTWKNPLRDGDEERPDDESYAKAYFINANSKRRPGIVDENRNEIIDAEEFYSGCFGRASINFYAFNFNGTKGVAAGLQNLQKLADGDRLGGGVSSPEDDFSDTDDLL